MVWARVNAARPIMGESDFKETSQVAVVNAVSIQVTCIKNNSDGLT